MQAADELQNLATSCSHMTSNPLLKQLQLWATPLTLLFASAVLGSVFRWSRQPAGTLPPSPGTAFPILGHLHLLQGKTDPRVTFEELRNKLGDIFSFYAGNRLIVVLNGYDVIREALVKKAAIFSCRPHTFMSQQMGQGKGIVNTSGTHWREQRQFSDRALKSLGFTNDSVMAAKIQDGVDDLLQQLETARCQGQPIQPGPLLMQAFCNVVISIVYGHRFHMDDPKFCGIMTALRNCFEHFGNTEPLNFFPLVRYLPGDPFRYWFCIENVNVLEGLLVRPEMAEHERKLSDDDDAESDDVMSSYLREMKKKESSGTPTTMDRENLVKVAGDFLAGGTEPPFTTAHWCLLYMVAYPQVQEKCYQEIVDKIGENRRPSLDDRSNLPYFEATIMEVQRHADVGPFSMAHGASRDTELRGFHIPHDAIVLINIHSVHHEQDYWGDPEVFRPERFLAEEEGALVVKRVTHFIPFSMGPRICPGENMAKMELFLFLSSILQRYRLTHHGHNPPSLQGRMTLLHSPLPFSIDLELRE